MATPKATPNTRFSIEALRFPLAALGFFGILAGLGAWLLNGQFDLLPRILIAAGILLLGINVALDPEDVWARLTGRGALLSGNTLVIAVAALAILGLANVLASRYSNKWDLTAGKQFTLSDQSIRIAQSLPAPVHATAFLGSNDTTKAQLQSLFDQYGRYSDGKLSYEFIDPETHPGEARAAGITQFGTIVYTMGDKKQNSTGSAERDISTALVKLTRPPKKVYFTTGHGERPLDGFDQTGLSQLKSALEGDNFTTATLNLTTTRTVPDDASMVVIAGASNPFVPEEIDALKAYLQGGGRLMILQDPGSKADFNDLLSPYGVSFTGGTVIDTGKAYLGDPRVPGVDSYAPSSITTDLRTITFYPLTTSITYPTDSSGGETATAIAQSSPQSWLNNNPQQLQQQPDDPKGPLAMVVSVEKPLDPNATPNASAAQSNSSSGPVTRIVLVGTSNLVTNGSQNIASGNQDLFLNSATWLASEDNLISVKPPDNTPRTLALTGQQMQLIMSASVIFLPLAVLAAGAAVWWTRR